MSEWEAFFMHKAKRHLKIKELVTTKEIETQDELVEMLSDAGFVVTQATISRDIKSLHLAKVPLPDGRYKYSLPLDHRVNPIQKLTRIMRDAFIKIDTANNLIVVKSLPGNANAIGVLIDQLEWSDIVGTICGDDNLLIICQTSEEAEMVTHRLLSLM